VHEIVEQLARIIRTAGAERRMLRLRGGGTKDFYGTALNGEILDTASYRGIVGYEPSELVITARCGTPLADIEAAMHEQGQMLAFEPPHFGPGATLGGCVAAGLSGPRRPHAGAVRDLVLGVRILDGKGQNLRFGGQVMKNVAGYDVSRLMAGSMGTLGVILEVSLKALPLPVAELTVRREHTQAEAIALMNEWAGKPLPLSATCHFDNTLCVRLSGAAAAVRAAREKLGGEEVPNGAGFWESVREQRHAFFVGDTPLWRMSIKSSTPPLILPGAQLIEWGGALRWVTSAAGTALMREVAASGGGHATLFRAQDKSDGAFHPLSPALAKIHRRLKDTFDPAGVFNHGRLYPEL
jgi:glycolate oxidase FAD binding subunit